MLSSTDLRWRGDHYIFTLHFSHEIQFLLKKKLQLLVQKMCKCAKVEREVDPNANP